jgi:putative spermidine/putrescine transport system permease protein
MSNRLSGPIAWLLFPITMTVMLFILAPLVVTVAMSISDTAFVAFPPRGFTCIGMSGCCAIPSF